MLSKLIKPLPLQLSRSTALKSLILPSSHLLNSQPKTFSAASTAGGMQSSPPISMPDPIHSSNNIPEDMRTYWEIEDRTSLAFSLRDQTGVLQKALDVFTNNGINLTRIQSRPPKIINETKYIDFYADLEGKLSEPNIDKAIT